MIHPATCSGFGDELQKLSGILGQVGKGLAGDFKEGWRDMIRPGNSRMARYAKPLFVGGTALTAYDALQPQDSLGQNRTKQERVAAGTGGTLGGIAGAGGVLRTAWGARHPGWAATLGGIGGSLIGERLLAHPFAHARKAQAAHDQAQQQQMMPQQGYAP